MGPLLIAIGLLITLFGILVTLWEKLGLPRLPGDILIQKGNVTFYFPVVTLLLLSILATIIVNIFFRK